jgi:hypothetical protein
MAGHPEIQGRADAGVTGTGERLMVRPSQFRLDTWTKSQAPAGLLVSPLAGCKGA